MIKYCIENFDGQSVSGWAHDDTPDSKPVKVTVGIQGGFRSAEATIFRDHLKHAGIGDGAAGFVIALNKGERFDPSTDILFESNQQQLVHFLPDSLKAFLVRENSPTLFLNVTEPFIRCAIALIIKNEASYLSEWLEYHRLIGIDHFLIFDNDSTDSIHEVLSPYVTTGIVTLLHWPNLSAAPETAKLQGWIEQDTAYACATRLMTGKAAWIGFLDVDEFLVFESRQQLDVKQFLDGFGSSMVSLFWRLFGTSGITERPPGLVIENFVRRGKDNPRALTKVFARPEHIHSILNAHRISVGADRMTGFTTDGAEAYGQQQLNASFQGAWIHHYHTRSRSEYKAKAQRGWPKNTDQKNFDWKRHFELHDKNDVADETIKHLASEVRGRMEAMKNLAFSNSFKGMDPQWIRNFPATMLFHAEVASRHSDQILIEGFAVDVAQPWERVSLLFHDGYGNSLTLTTAELFCDALRARRIGDGHYGFAVSIPSTYRLVHFLSEKIAGTVRLDESAKLGSLAIENHI